MRRFEYKVKVSFDKTRKECTPIDFTSGYIGCQGNEDNFRFNKSGFTLIAQRSIKYESENILSCTENTLNSQILKGVLFYCSVAHDMPEIRKVSIKLYRGKKEIFSYSETDIDGVLFLSKIKMYFFLPEHLAVIFENTRRSYAIRISLSYWLKAVGSKSCYQKFDYLWRSFGRLYLFNANTKQDHEGQKIMRRLIIDNQDKFQVITNKINAIPNQILSEFNWRKLIIHDYDSPKKTWALAEFIKRYTDGRIMRVIYNNINSRDKYLKCRTKDNLWDGRNGVEKWMSSHFNTRNDIELIPFLCIKYAYFLRNLYIHGEIPENTIKLKKGKDEKIMEILNDLLECLIYELIINYKLLRKVCKTITFLMTTFAI